MGLPVLRGFFSALSFSSSTKASIPAKASSRGSLFGLSSDAA